MLFRIISIFMLFVSSALFAEDTTVIDANTFNRYLKSKRPYSEYVKKLEVEDEKCLTNNDTNLAEVCTIKKEIVVDDEKLKELEELVASKQAEMNEYCKNPRKPEYDKVMPELCNRFKGLKNFIIVSKKLEKCKTDKNPNVNDYIDRLIDATGAEAEKDCLRDIKDSEALDEETGQVVKDLSGAVLKEVENKEFKELSEFLIEDGLNESVKASLVFGAALGDSREIDLDTLCLEEKNSRSGKSIYDHCGARNRSYVEELRQKKLKSEKDIIENQNIEESRNIINTKIELLNKASFERNRRIREYNVKYAEYTKRETARIIGLYTPNTPQGFRDLNIRITNANKRYKAKYFDPINQKYEIERNRILNEKAKFGTDELYQTDFLRERLNLSSVGERLSKNIEKLTGDEVLRSFQEAKRRSDEQVASLSRIKNDLQRKQREVSSAQRKGRGRRSSSYGYNDQKKELMRLVRANPVSVGRALINNPRFANNICKVAESLRKQKRNQLYLDRTFFIVGVGTAVASGVATGGVSPAVILFTGAGVGLTLTSGELISNYYYGNIELTRQKDFKGAAIVGVSDSKGVRDIEVSEDNLKDIILNAKITAVTGLADLKGVRNIAGFSGKGKKNTRKIEKIEKRENTLLRFLRHGRIHHNGKALNLTPEDIRLWENANEVLWDDLHGGISYRQFELIKQAHEVGEGQEGLIPGTKASSGNYTQKQKLKKIRLLKKAGLGVAQRRLLFENGIVGYSDNFRELNEVFRKTITSNDAYRINGDDVLDRNKAIKKDADDIGVELRLITGTGENAETLLLSRSKYKHHGGASVVDFNANPKPFQDGSSYSSSYGQIYRVTKIPTETKGTGINDSALTHPQLGEVIKRLEKLDVDLNIDTTIGFRSSIKAAYSSRSQSINILPDTDWTTLLHEVQHAEFDHLVKNSKIFQEEQVIKTVEKGKLVTIVIKREDGKVVSEVKKVDKVQDDSLIENLDDGRFEAVTLLKVKPEYENNFVDAVRSSGLSYTEDEIKLIKDNLDKGYTKTAINERLSHNRQLALLPEENRFISSRSDNRELHALHHEASQLEKLKEFFPNNFQESFHGRALEDVYKRFQELQEADLAVVKPLP